ncbi:MAG: N-acetyltransferase [Chloroflexi bacterium]|nr:MAG: N-acetyltransferase [Chloroflexota bacterium]
MNVTLQLATEAERQLLEGYVHSYHEFEGVSHPGQNAVAAILPLLGQSPRGRIWLICLGAEPIGYVAICFGYTIEFSGRDAFVDEMFITEAHRGKGYGKEVFCLVKAEAASLGVKVLHLEVARSNERAQRLYRSVGFVARERFFLMSAPIDAQSGTPANGLAAAEPSVRRRRFRQHMEDELADMK